MSSAWKPSAQALADAIGGEVLETSNEFREDDHLLIHRCPDGRVIVFEDWWFRVSEFASEEAFQQALAESNEDFPYNLDLATVSIQLE